MRYRLLNYYYWRDRDQAIGLGTTAHKELAGDIPTRAQVEQAFSSINRNSFVMGAFNNKSLVGVVWTANTPSEEKDRYTITNMYVQPDERRKGVAKNLMESLLAVLDTSNPNHVSALEVDHGNDAALNLYKSFNFQEIHSSNPQRHALERQTFSHILRPEDLAL